MQLIQLRAMDDIGEEGLSMVQNEGSNACLPDPKELGLHGMRSPTSLLTDIGYFVYPLHQRHPRRRRCLSFEKCSFYCRTSNILLMKLTFTPRCVVVGVSGEHGCGRRGSDQTLHQPHQQAAGERAHIPPSNARLYICSHIWKWNVLQLYLSRY